MELNIILTGMLLAVLMTACFLLGWFGRVAIGQMDTRRRFKKTDFNSDSILQDMDDEFTPRPPSERNYEPFRYSEAGTTQEETGPDMKEDELKE